MTTTDAEPVHEEWGFWKRLTRRKWYLYPFKPLDAKLQFNIAILLVVVGAANALYFGLLFYMYAQESLFRAQGWVPDYALEGLLQEQMDLWTRTLVFGVAFEVVLVLLLGLFFSHRIAGPLYAMGLRLNDIARGVAPKPVVLRKKDLLTNFAAKLNEAIRSLSRREGELAAALKEVEAGDVVSGAARLKKLTASGRAPAISSPGGTPPPA